MGSFCILHRLGLLMLLRVQTEQNVRICWIDITQPAQVNPWRSTTEGLQKPVAASL